MPPRALDTTAMRTEADTLMAELAISEQACIQPATGAATDTLESWDAFVSAA